MEPCCMLPSFRPDNLIHIEAAFSLILSKILERKIVIDTF